MIKLTKQQEIGLWEAWIEFDHTTPHYFGMLYVVGEIETGKAHHPYTIRREQSSTSCELVLRIEASILPRGTALQEVHYSEPITSIDQYSSIAVYLGNELIEKIEDIEVMI
ncbi:MAG TPA: hypothetical protein VGB46_00920 [Flavisolibacter sp.]|jgi:hypothetical protein